MLNVHCMFSLWTLQVVDGTALYCGSGLPTHAPCHQIHVVNLRIGKHREQKEHNAMHSTMKTTILLI